MTTTPFIDTVPMSARMASTAAPSAPFLSPRPTQRPAAIAAASVTRTSSRARLRSGASTPTRKDDGRCCSDMHRSFPRRRGGAQSLSGPGRLAWGGAGGGRWAREHPGTAQLLRQRLRRQHGAVAAGHRCPRRAARRDRPARQHRLPAPGRRRVERRGGGPDLRVAHRAAGGPAGGVEGDERAVRPVDRRPDDVARGLPVTERQLRRPGADPRRDQRVGVGPDQPRAADG